MKKNPLKPDSSLLVMVASILVHVDEGMSSGNHPFDWVAVKGLLEDEMVHGWLVELDKLFLLPLRRDGKKYE